MEKLDEENLESAPAAASFDRVAPLVLDESSSELGLKNKQDELNRLKITQKDLGSLSIIGSLTRVEYGKWGSEDACLIGFRFQFQKGTAKAFRFKTADILVEFQARPPGDPNDDPAVLRYGPKRLQSTGTSEERDWGFSVSLSANAGVGPVQAGPTLELARGGSFKREYAAIVESDDWGNRKHTRPNCVKIWLSEDEKQKDGVPLELLAAVIVDTNRPFQATVSIKVDFIFNFLARPWSKDDPLFLQPGVGFGPALRPTPMPDFSTMTTEEWRQLVTPDLHLKQSSLHS